MLNFPNTTCFNRRIPKQRFYNNLSITTDLKRAFIDQIRFIYWRNKIAPTTVNIANGETVHEIQIIEICLHQPYLDERVLKLIDKEIPYHILFVLSYYGNVQAWMSYKEQNQVNADTFRVGTYFHTDWVEESEIRIKLEGLSMDSVYESFLRQIAPDVLAKQSKEGSIKDAVENSEKEKLLQRQIIILEKKIIREKQFNRQVELSGELKLLKAELERLK